MGLESANRFVVSKTVFFQRLIELRKINVDFQLLIVNNSHSLGIELPIYYLYENILFTDLKYFLKTKSMISIRVLEKWFWTTRGVPRAVANTN